MIHMKMIPREEVTDVQEEETASVPDIHRRRGAKMYRGHKCQDSGLEIP